MKVLILHQHFNTPEQGGALRSYYLAKALVDHGLEVVVITGRTQSQGSVIQYDGIEIHYLPVSYDNKFGFYKRATAFLRYAVNALQTARTIKNIDLCYAISVPLTVGETAIWLQRLYNVPFYFEVGDLWPEAPIQLGFIKNPLAKAFFFNMEQRIYRQAKKVVALSEPIRKAVELKRGRNDVAVIPNMADTEFFYPAHKDPVYVDQYNLKDQFVVSYIGAVGFANGLDFFMECARASMKAGLPVRFLLCGEGAMLEGLRAVKEAQRLDNVTFVPFQNRDGVRKIMSVTDAAFICYRTFPVLETGSPNKYFDGLAAGKLIVINFSGWIREEIERESCGVFIDPRYPTDFVNKIKPMIADRNLLMRYQQASRELALKKYDRKLLSDKFASLFSS